MSARKKKELSENELSGIAGGITNRLDRIRVKCPVEGCSFECSTFHEMNQHMRTAHIERC